MLDVIPATCSVDAGRGVLPMRPPNHFFGEEAFLFVVVEDVSEIGKLFNAGFGTVTVVPPRFSFDAPIFDIAVEFSGPVFAPRTSVG